LGSPKSLEYPRTGSPATCLSLRRQYISRYLFEAFLNVIKAFFFFALGTGFWPGKHFPKKVIADWPTLKKPRPCVVPVFFILFLIFFVFFIVFVSFCWEGEQQVKVYKWFIFKTSLKIFLKCFVFLFTAYVRRI